MNNSDKSKLKTLHSNILLYLKNEAGRSKPQLRELLELGIGNLEKAFDIHPDHKLDRGAQGDTPDLPNVDDLLEELHAANRDTNPEFNKDQVNQPAPAASPPKSPSISEDSYSFRPSNFATVGSSALSRRSDLDDYEIEQPFSVESTSQSEYSYYHGEDLDEAVADIRPDGELQLVQPGYSYTNHSTNIADNALENIRLNYDSSDEASDDPHRSIDLGSSQAPPIQTRREDFSELHNAVGNQMSIERRYGEALIQYTKAMKANPTEPLYVYNRAVTHYYMGIYALCIEDCKRALQLDTNFPKAYGQIGKAYLQVGDYASAEVQYHTALQMQPFNKGYMKNLKLAQEKNRK